MKPTKSRRSSGIRGLFAFLAFGLLLLVSTPARAQSFTYLAPGWLTPQVFTMDPIWSAFGLPERGTNTYTFGSTGSTGQGLSASFPYMARFDPADGTYQSFVGVYDVSSGFPYASEWSGSHLTVASVPNSAALTLALSVADQIGWLAAYGAPPIASVVPGSELVFQIDGRHFGVIVQIASVSDVGAAVSPPSPPFPPYPPYSAVSSQVSVYEPLTLNALIEFTYTSTGHFLMSYIVAAERKDANGHVIWATPPAVALQQALMFASIHI